MKVVSNRNPSYCGRIFIWKLHIVRMKISSKVTQSLNLSACCTARSRRRGGGGGEGGILKKNTGVLNFFILEILGFFL
jgi:hypothetical protein